METVKLKIPKTLERELQRRRMKRTRRVKPPLPPSPTSASENSESEDDQKLLWRPVLRSQIRSGFDDAAVLAFEEIDDVNVVYEDLEGGGRVAKLAVLCSRSVSVLLR